MRQKLNWKANLAKEQLLRYDSKIRIKDKGQVMLHLPENFETFEEVKKQSFLRIMKEKEEGKKLVGVFCTYTPLELIMAAGANFVSLCGGSDHTIAAAETLLPKNLCPLIKSSYGF